MDKNINKKLKSVGISDAEFSEQMRQAKERGKNTARYEPRAISAQYKDNQILITLSTGWTFSFNPSVFAEFANADESQIADIKILGRGYTIEWTALDAHIGVGNMLIELLGEKFLKSEIARKKVIRKSVTSVKNGKKVANL